jgi:hypothetical protein
MTTAGDADLDCLPEPDLVTTLECLGAWHASCRLRAWQHHRQWVVELEELSGDKGLPVRVAFPHLAARALQLLPDADRWIEYWPQRALATLLLDGMCEPARHLWTPLPHGGWQRSPLTLRHFGALLLADESGAEPSTSRQRRAASQQPGS